MYQSVIIVNDDEEVGFGCGDTEAYAVAEAYQAMLDNSIGGRLTITVWQDGGVSKFVQPNDARAFHSRYF